MLITRGVLCENSDAVKNERFQSVPSRFAQRLVSPQEHFFVPRRDTHHTGERGLHGTTIRRAPRTRSTLPLIRGFYAALVVPQQTTQTLLADNLAQRSIRRIQRGESSSGSRGRQGLASDSAAPSRP